MAQQPPLAPLAPTQVHEELGKLLDGSTSCFSFRPLSYAEGISNSSLPVFISTQDLAPLPASLPFISIADIPKLPSLNNNGLSLNILDLPLFASLKSSDSQNGGALPRSMHPHPQPQEPAKPLPRPKDQKSKLSQCSNLGQQKTSAPDLSPKPEHDNIVDDMMDDESLPSEDGDGDESQGTDEDGPSHTEQGKRTSLRGGKSKGPAAPAGVGKGRVKKDRADRKRTLNREAQRRFRDRQKAALGELEERNLKQQQEIDSLKVSNKILQENYLALLDSYKSMQAKVLQLQLRTGVVLV